MKIAPDTEVIKMQLQEVVQTGGGGSDEIWLPSVSEEGVISWTKSASSTAPTERNIKGADGQDGTDGTDGVGIASIEKTSTSGLVDTYTITLTNGNTATFNVTNGQNGQNGADGLGIKSVAVNGSNHLIVTYDDDTPEDAGEIDVSVPIDDTTPASDKVYSSEKVEQELLDCEVDVTTNKLDVTPDLKLNDIASQNPVYLYANENLCIMEDVAETTSKQVTFKVENNLIYVNGTATGTAQITIPYSVPQSLIGCPVLMGLELVSGTAGKFTIQMPVKYVHQTQGETQATITSSSTTLQGVSVSDIAASGKIYCSSGIVATNAVFRPYLIEEVYAKRGASTSGNPTASRTAVSSSLSGATGTLRCMTGAFSANIKSKNKYDVLFGKRLVLCGDSIAQGNKGESYGRLIANNENMSFENHAQSGATLSTYNTLTVTAQVASLTADYDYIMIQGGINDRGHSVPLGTLSSGYDDALDLSTVIGATEYICKTIITNYPSAKKLFVLNHRVTNTSYVPYDSQDTYFDAIISALEKWNFPYIDLRKYPLCAYNATYVSLYFDASNFATYGGLHPNTDGYKFGYVDQITAKLKSL